jgi:LysM repeat protein
MLGQRIKLGGTARQPVAGPASHRVKNGDTLSDIAQRYEVSLSALKNLNRLSSNTIRVGQILKLR